MTFLKNMKIGSRLAIAFTTAIGLAGIIGLLSIAKLADVTNSLTLIDEDRAPNVQMLIEVSDKVNVVAQELRNALIFRRGSRRSRARKFLARRSYQKTLLFKPKRG